VPKITTDKTRKFVEKITPNDISYPKTWKNLTMICRVVPAEVDVGVSYLNDPEEVEAILTKVGKRDMKETTDKKEHI